MSEVFGNWLLHDNKQEKLFPPRLFPKHSLGSPCPRLLQTSAHWQPVLDALLWASENHRFQSVVALALSEPQATGLVTALSQFVVIFFQCTHRPVKSCFPGSDNHWAMARRQICMGGILCLRRKKEISPNRLAVPHPWGLAVPHAEWFLSKQAFFRFRQLTKVSGCSTFFLKFVDIAWHQMKN